MRGFNLPTDELLPLSTADVIDEVAAILARAVLRLARDRLSQPVKFTDGNSETPLDNQAK